MEGGSDIDLGGRGGCSDAGVGIEIVVCVVDGLLVRVGVVTTTIETTLSVRSSIETPIETTLSVGTTVEASVETTLVESLSTLPIESSIEPLITSIKSLISSLSLSTPIIFELFLHLFCKFLLHGYLFGCRGWMVIGGELVADDVDFFEGNAIAFRHFNHVDVEFLGSGTGCEQLDDFGIGVLGHCLRVI